MSRIDQVREFVVNNFLFGDGAKLQTDTSFMESGIIDSTGILEVITFLEQTYGVHVADEEMVPENMDSLRNIEGFLDRKLGKEPAQASSA
jgi:acyl carrier protein